MRADELAQRAMLKELKGKETVTKSGRKLHLYANIGSTGDVANVLANDAEGIGLFRSEFVYLEKEDYPTEEEQFQVYKTVAQNMAGKKLSFVLWISERTSRSIISIWRMRRTLQWDIVRSVSVWTVRKYLRHS